MRNNRELVDGAAYHVTAQANRQEFIFNSDIVKEMFLKTIERAKEKYEFRIDNFCIMDNHIHLLIEPLKGESLSKIMQWILGVFAQKFNRFFKLKGHVWYDRFKSVVIQDFEQYVRVFRYISNNPVVAEMVKRAVEYRYNGIFHLANGIYKIVSKPSKWILKSIMPGIA